MAGALFIEAAINRSLEGWKKEQWMALGGSKNRLSHEPYKCLHEKTFLFEENEKKKNETRFGNGVKSISHPNERMYFIKKLYSKTREIKDRLDTTSGTLCLC